MTKYYIKISDEEPLPTDESIWFTLEAVENGEDQFWIIRENEYNTLKGRVDQAVEDFTNSPDVISAVQTVINSQGFEPLSCVQSKKVVDDNDDSLSYDYDDLESIDSLTQELQQGLTGKVSLNDVDDEIDPNSANPVKNYAISSALGNKVNTTDFNNAMETKSNTTHDHNDWTKVTFNNYCTGYYNDKLRIFTMRYYRPNYNTSQGATTIHTGLFSNYKPIEDVIISSYNPKMSAMVESGTGSLKIYSISTGTYSINLSGIWRY